VQLLPPSPATQNGIYCIKDYVKGYGLDADADIGGAANEYRSDGIFQIVIIWLLRVQVYCFNRWLRLYGVR